MRLLFLLGSLSGNGLRKQMQLESDLKIKSDTLCLLLQTLLEYFLCLLKYLRKTEVFQPEDCPKLA